MGDGELRVVDRRPSGLLAVPGLFVPVAVCGIPGHPESVARIAAEIAVLALVVGIVGFESTAGAGLVVVVSSLLSLNGFVEDRYGQLGWHPGVDLRAAAVLCAAWTLAYAARSGVDRDQPHRLSHHARCRAEVPIPRMEIDERRRVRRADTRAVRRVGPGAPGVGAAVSADNLVGLALAVLVTGFLLVALLFPERF